MTTTERIDDILAGGEGNDPAMDELLDAVLEHFSCVVGTIHSYDPASRNLLIAAHRGVPPMLLDKVSVIPIGKGMAGLAAERKEPVQVCNLQTDESGAAKPAARETRMEGSLTVPVLAGEELRGTLGIAKPVEYEFTRQEIDELMEIGRRMASYL